MSDLISKQDVLDALHEYFDGMTETDTICPVDVYGEIETINSKIIHCRDCVFKELQGVDWYCDHITGEEIMVRPNDYCSWAERGNGALN